MTPATIALVFLAYTALLFIVSYFTSRKADNRAFFIGNKNSPWLVVAYGMVGASLSGVTFISVPGWVHTTQFSYLMVVLGYILGYGTIAGILLPLYYRLNLTSIYTYLEQRFGFWSYKSGAALFLFSRFIGSSLRMYLVINVLQIFVFDAWGVPFGLTVVLFIGLILLYTFKGGIKTIVWTDTLQTTFMLASVILTLYFVSKGLNISFWNLVETVRESDYSKVIYTDWQDSRYFLKQFFSGAFIAIVMTGLDQDMMQKNLSCRTLPDAQKNMVTLSITLVFVNLLFLILGAALFIYAAQMNIALPAKTDDVFPLLAFKHMPALAGVVFIIGLISAAYSSADSALTALTTSISVDFLGLEKTSHLTDMQRKRTRRFVHIVVSLVVLLVIVVFRELNNKAIIDDIFTIAGYTYGPLLGLFAFGLFTKSQIRDRYVPVIALFSPFICYILSANSQEWLGGYRFGFELLILNGLITFFLLWLARIRK